MERSWYWKVGFVVVLVLVSVLYLLPTFFSGSLPGWYGKIFEKKINLGLDLQGGIHLVLGVEVEKALEDKADQYAADFKDILKEKRIGYKHVARVPGTYDIEIVLKDPADAKKLRRRVLRGYYNLEEVSSTGTRQEGTEAAGKQDAAGVIRLTFSAKHVQELRKNARDQALVTIRNRVDELGVAMPDIAPHGENGVLVQLPGLFDPERAKKLLGRTAQLEFKMVDDKSDFIKSLKDKLPEGIKIDYYTYAGPNDEPVTEAYLVARGKGNEGKNRLLDFFNNVAEIDAYLLEQKVDPELRKKIVGLCRSGISERERKEVIKLARKAFGVSEDKAAVTDKTTAPEKAAGGEKAAGEKTAGGEKSTGEEAAGEKTAGGEKSTGEKAAGEKTAAAAGADKDATVEEKKTEAASDTHAQALAKLAHFEKLLRGKVPEDHEIGFKRTEKQLEVEYRTFYLFKEVSLTGDYITDAHVRPDPETGRPEVGLNFDRIGARKFEKLTGAHVRERMAIVLEGEVSSAPVIQTRIGGGRARITMGTGGNYNEVLADANDLAAVLRAGALPAPVRILEERTVGPTMGEDARRQGSYALAIGMALVVLFMVLYYRLAGLVADLALLLNAVFILAVMSAVQATLTLPGIAGIILTIGMAVDANVIINERIREELRLGKTARAAVEAGYGRAFWTIFDANFTTLIAAVVLWSYGSGPVQGFAVTLFIGIFASMFTAIFVTRLVVDYLVIRLKVQKLSI